MPDGRSGLYLRVYPSGAKRWVFRYRFRDGDQRKRTRVVFGTYPTKGLAEARADAARFKMMVREGRDPAHELQRVREAEKARRTAEREEWAQAKKRGKAEANALTVQRLADLYLEGWAKPNKRSWKQDERILNLDVLPRWGRRRAEDISRADVAHLLQEIAARGAPVAANRTRALLSKLFNWAIGQAQLLDHNPVQGVKPVALERPRQRVLSEHEIRTFWAALDRTPLSDAVKRALRLILTTAQRPGEVAGMRFEEIEIHNGRPVWRIPGERRKSGTPHLVPLSGLARELIGPWEDREGPVFPGSNGEPVRGTSLSRALARQVKGTDHRDPWGIPLARFTPHDLRRTAATLMSAAGVPLIVKPLVLGHVPQDITRRRYDLFDYLAEKARALDLWARWLEERIRGEPDRGEVIRFPGAR